MSNIEARKLFKPGDVVRVKNKLDGGPWTVKSMVPVLSYSNLIETYEILIVKNGGVKRARLMQEHLQLETEPASSGLTDNEEETDDEDEEADDAAPLTDTDDEEEEGGRDLLQNRFPRYATTSPAPRTMAATTLVGTAAATTTAGTAAATTMAGTAAATTTAGTAAATTLVGTAAATTTAGTAAATTTTGIAAATAVTGDNIPGEYLNPKEEWEMGSDFEDEIVQSSSPIRKLTSDLEMDSEEDEHLRIIAEDLLPSLENNTFREDIRDIAEGIMADLAANELGIGPVNVVVVDHRVHHADGDVCEAHGKPETQEEIKSEDLPSSMIITNKETHSASVFDFEETESDFFIPLEKTFRSLNSATGSHSPEEECRGLKRILPGGTIAIPKRLKNLKADTLTPECGSLGPGNSFPRKLKPQKLFLKEKTGAEVEMADKRDIDKSSTELWDSFKFKSVEFIRNLIAWAKELSTRRACVLNVEDTSMVKEELGRINRILEEVNEKKIDVDKAVEVQKEWESGNVGGLEMENLEEIWRSEVNILEERQVDLVSMVADSEVLNQRKIRVSEDIWRLYRRQLAMEPELAKVKIELEAQKCQNEDFINALEGYKIMTEKFWELRTRLVNRYSADRVTDFSALKEETDAKYEELKENAIQRRKKISTELIKMTTLHFKMHQLSTSLDGMEDKLDGIRLVGKLSKEESSLIVELKEEFKHKKKEYHLIKGKLEDLETSWPVMDVTAMEKNSELVFRMRGIETQLEQFKQRAMDETSKASLSRELWMKQFKQRAVDETSKASFVLDGAPVFAEDVLIEVLDEEQCHLDESGKEREENFVEPERRDVNVQTENRAQKEVGGRKQQSNSRASLQMPVDKNQRKGRLLTDEELNALKRSTDGYQSSKKKDALKQKFLTFLKEDMNETREISELPDDILDGAVATFWWDKMREKDGNHPDPGTLTTEFSRLNSVLTYERGGRDMLSEEFKSKHQKAKIAKAAKLAAAKKVEGNGQLEHQPDALYPQEIRYFVQSGLVNCVSGWGIIRTILLHVVCNCSQRPIKDEWRMPLDAIKITYDDDGNILFADVLLQFDKRDTGVKKNVGRAPRITPMKDKNKCFFTAFYKYKLQRQQLGPQFLEADSPMFLEPRNTHDFVGTNNNLLFKPKALSEDAISKIAKNLAIEAGLNLDGRKITNMSLRVHNFQQQISLEVTPEQGQTMSNHHAPSTRRTYNRKNGDMMDVLGGAMAAAMTGTAAMIPVPAGVRAVAHLRGPPTCRDGPSNMEPTTLKVETGRTTSAMLEAGDSAKDAVGKDRVFFDGIEKQAGMSLYGGYMQHIASKYEPDLNEEEDEEDMVRLFGEPNPACPPLPDFSQAVEIEPTPAPDKNRYDADGDLKWHSRQPLKEKPVQKNTGARPKKKEVEKEPEKELEENELVFAREFEDEKTGQPGMMWPAVVTTVHRLESGEVSGYRVEYICHYKKEKGNVGPKHVKIVNDATVKKWGSPSFNKKPKAKKDSFGSAMKRLAQEGLNRGKNLQLQIEEDADADKEN